MGLIVNTNMDAIAVHGNLTRTNNYVTKSLQRLSSGLKINSAKDDASGFAIANSFKAKIAAMRVSSQNASEGQSMLQVADGAYSRINDILVRMKSLATQAASGQTESLTTMNNEFFALQNEIDQIANSTQYGGTYLIKGGSSSGGSSGVIPDLSAQISQYSADELELWQIGMVFKTDSSADDFWFSLYDANYKTLNTSNASAIVTFITNYLNTNTVTSTVQGIANDMIAQANAIVSALPPPSAGSDTVGITFQVGATNASTDRLVISFNGATSNSLGVSSNSVGIASLGSAQAAMDAIDTALTSINSFMGSIGAYQNRLQYTIDNLATSIENYSSSESTIRDADMASEICDLSKSQILQQTGMAMLAQANSQPQTILTLLRG